MSTKDRSDAEKLRRLADFRQRLEKRIEETSAELEELLGLLELTDAVLLDKGFKRAEIAKPAAEPVTHPVAEPVAAAEPAKTIRTAAQPAVEYESVVPLKTVTGDLLANLYSGKDSLRVILAGDKRFNVNTPPFMQFLVERVFIRMQDKDRQAVSAGELEPDSMFSFKIVQEGDVLKEIYVEHVSEDRLRELKSSIRWTLEKMYEKDRLPDI